MLQTGSKARKTALVPSGYVFFFFLRPELPVVVSGFEMLINIVHL